MVLAPTLLNLPERERINALKTSYALIRARQYSNLWRPLSGPQTAAAQCLADELFYGGSAGGGKTDLIIGLSITQHTKSVIYRREYGQLRAIIERSQEIVGENGRYNHQLKIWRFKWPKGISLEFGAIEHETDRTKWAGRPHALKAFDEIPEFLESQFRFVKAWTRTTNPNERTRVVCTGNPPTSAEGEWVILYWGPWLDSQHSNPAIPGELRWFTTMDGKDHEVESSTPFEYKGEVVHPVSRTFIPAALKDNPLLERTGYRQTLQALPEPLRTQLLYGDFTIGLQDDQWQVIPSEWIRAAQERWKPKNNRGIPLHCVGIDVAQGGRDNTAIARRHHWWFAPIETHPGASVPNAEVNAGYVEKALMPGGIGIIDCDGIGASTFYLARHRQTCAGRVLPFVGSTRLRDITDRSGQLPFSNLRAAAYWSLREALDPANGLKLQLPPHRELAVELAAPHYKLIASGILMEPKKDIANRLGRSPDYADSLVMAALNPELAKKSSLIMTSGVFEGEQSYETNSF